MADKAKPEDGKAPRDARADRLAAALRANLRRRKQQARERAGTAKAPSAPGVRAAGKPGAREE